MESLANALAITGFDPAKLIVLFFFLIVIYVAYRLIDGWLGSPWIKKVADEIALYEKISALSSNGSAEKTDWESLLKLKQHINLTICRHTTRMEHIKQFVDMFQFTVIGLVSYGVVILWQLIWDEIDTANKDQVLLFIIVFVLLFITLLLLDLLRIAWVYKIYPALKLYIRTYRIKREASKLAKGSKTNFENLQKIERAVSVIVSEISPLDLDQHSREALAQIRKLAQKQVEDEETIRQNAVDRQAKYTELLDSGSLNRLTRANIQQLEASNLETIKNTEQAIEMLQKIDKHLAK